MAHQKPVEPRGQHPVPRHPAVDRFGNPPKRGKMPVEPEKPRLAGMMRQNLKNRFGAAGDGAVRRNQLDRFPEFLRGNLRKTRKDFLIRRQVDGAAGEEAPSFSVPPAKPAISVVDEKGFFGIHPFKRASCKCKTRASRTSCSSVPRLPLRSSAAERWLFRPASN